MLFGQVRVGNCASITVTVNEQLPESVPASVAEQVTVVVPFANVVPEAGTHVTAETPGQLSVAVAGG
jgi:hypothetical protein